MLGTLVHKQEWSAAFIFAIGFDCFLRCGELLALKHKDLEIGNQHGVIRLRFTKSGQRTASTESLTFDDPLLSILYQKVQAHTLPGRAALFISR